MAWGFLLRGGREDVPGGKHAGGAGTAESGEGGWLRGGAGDPGAASGGPAGGGGGRRPHGTSGADGSARAGTGCTNPRRSRPAPVRPGDAGWICGGGGGAFAGWLAAGGGAGAGG